MLTRRCLSLIVAIGLSFVSATSLAAIATTAALYLNAKDGGLGGAVGAEEVFWKHGIDGVFSSSAGADKGVDISFNNASFWTFAFAAPTYDPVTNTNDGNRLRVGFYDKAERLPFNSPNASRDGHQRQRGWQQYIGGLLQRPRHCVRRR